MEIIREAAHFHLCRPTAVALGKFDGVHLGHRRLLDEILGQRQKGLAACVFTFDPPPSLFFGGGDGRELTTREEKRLLFERMGIDILIEFPLTGETAATPPEEFIRRILAEEMHTRFIAAGVDVSFGAGGRGNASLLENLAEECGYVPRIIEKVELEGQVISSSRVRKQVEAGNMPEAEKLLGMPYTVMGQVAHGKGLGRTLGIPTVNLIPPSSKLMPPCGVYASAVWLGGKRYSAVSNVGYKPTVTQEHILGLESYLYDFEDEIYGEEIAVQLLEFERPERRFENVEELKKQLEKDIRAGQPEMCKKCREFLF